MDQQTLLVACTISSLALALPLAVLVGVSAGTMIHTFTSSQVEKQVENLAVNIAKEQILEKLKILYRVYNDTRPNLNLPQEVDLQAVAERVIFSVDNIHWLNQIYLDLVNQGTQCEYFIQVIQFLSG